VSVKLTVPPVGAGLTVAVKVTAAPNCDGWADEVTAVVVGLSGTKLLDGADATLVAAALEAVAVQVYVSPLVNPFTTIGEPDPDAEPVAPPLDDVHVTV
jgi:hypothetical protein